MSDRETKTELQKRSVFQHLPKFFTSQSGYLVLVIIAVCTVATILNPRFLSGRNISNIMQQISVLGILTMCMALLMISGNLDISIGSMAGLVGMIFTRMVLSGRSQGLAVMVVLAISTVLGLINGLIITKSKTTPLIITLGMMYVYYGIALIISEGRPHSLGGQFEFLGRAKIGPIPFTIIIYVSIFALAYLLRKYTTYGRRINAIGGNKEAAFLSGINVDHHIISLYAMSGLVVGLAGLVLASRLGMVRADSGTGYELKALAATIIGGITFEGGRGSLVGAFLGVLLLGIMYNAMNIVGVSSYMQTVFLGAVIVIATVISNLGQLKKQ
ncbi:MAG: ABC transporter permease [Spirochaetaceae bacterium]|nr:ABC transporter permease [Spirochaetaceae bacterium]